MRAAATQILLTAFAEMANILMFKKQKRKHMFNMNYPNFIKGQPVKRKNIVRHKQNRSVGFLRRMGHWFATSDPISGEWVGQLLNL